MVNEKAKIIEKIENLKNKTVEEYNNNIKEIEEGGSLPEVYYLLAKTFHNTRVQGELGMELLRNNLENQFFKESELVQDVNHIVFSNDDFEIRFSKALERVIRIKYNHAGIKPYLNRVNPEIEKLGELLEDYLKDKSFKSFKRLADYNCERYRKGLIGTVLKYKDTYKKCNKELFNKIKADKERFEKAQIDYERKLKEFYDRQEYAKEFVENLTDIKKFSEEGWIIRLYGILDDGGIIRY